VSKVRRTDIADEDKSVVLLHLLHGTLSVERVNDDLVLIETGLASNGVTGVLGLTSSDQGCSSVSLQLSNRGFGTHTLRAMEGGAEASLDLLVGVGLFTC
jgi:hypothetical protein